MKNILFLCCFFFTFITYAQKSSDEKFIYDFLKKVIIERKLDLKKGLELELEQTATENEDDKTFLKSLLIDGKDSNEGKDIKKDTFTISFTEKCLTETEIESMLNQKEKHQKFKWDVSLLGFNVKNKKNRYSFSLPLFSSDKTKAIMMIKYLCPGLCGYGQTFLFTKENGIWTAKVLGMWYY